MKPELTNLLHRLRTQLDGFQTLVIFADGTALAQHRHGCHPFANLDAVEQFAYAPTPDPVAASLQGALPEIRSGYHAPDGYHALKEVRDALDAARHELVTFHGLLAADAASPSWTWTINTIETIKQIDAALLQCAPAVPRETNETQNLTQPQPPVQTPGRP